MKKGFALMLICCVLLTVCACSNTGSAGADNPAPPVSATQPASQGQWSGKMTPAAEALGITADNYPRIDGSTSTLPIVQALYRAMFGEEAESTSNYPTKASKTVPSYRLLINGEVDMIIVPYPSADVLHESEKAGVDLELHKVAAEGLIFITPVENSTESVTMEQVRKIYLNNGIKNWSVLGGPDRKLIPICRNSDSGSQALMDNLVLNNKKMHSSIRKNYVELTMEGMLEQVAFFHNGGLSGEPTNSYALGYTLYTYLQRMNEITGIGEYLKILAFEGVQPTTETIADGSYPLSDSYYAVIRSDLPEDHKARQLITWLQSEEGQALIEGLGLIACK